MIEVTAGIRIDERETVNPTDTFLRNGSRAEQLKDIPPPDVPGMEAAGVVDEVGAGATATGLKAGDMVLAIVVPKGSHGAAEGEVHRIAPTVAAGGAARRVRQWLNRSR